MTVLETVARVRVARGPFVERVVCHPRLPLIAGLDSERPAVHIWDGQGGRLRQLATVGAESTVYAGSDGWAQQRRRPAVAWHPERPLLMVADEDGVVRWTPDGLSAPAEPLPDVHYHDLAFAPDGRTLWASPSSRREEEDDWESSDVLDLDSGTVGIGPWWDTGVAEHPAGGLVLTYLSDQGATIGLFARVDRGTTPAAMRILRRALILDCDGYEKPVFSADGRHFAIRGNAYDNSLEVFEFPSLQRVLATNLGAPSPGYPYPEEWRAQMRAWSRHNIAFGAEPGVLWVGTPTGTLVEIDIDADNAVEHEVLTGSRVSALGAMATGGLVVAGSGGELVLLSVDAGSARGTAVDSAGVEAARRDSARAAVTAFLEATSEVPDDPDGDLESHLVLTDGTRTWESDDLATVTTAAGTDPTWLRLQAAVNGMTGNASADDKVLDRNR
ncbi:hypothetical protein ACWD4G_29255 [Streptomyces sp. NPDC002643]